MNNPFQVHIDIDEQTVSSDQIGYPVAGTKITFYNRGNIPVKVGEVPIVPGASYQVNYEHPHRIVKNFVIMFDTTATPVDAVYRAAYALENTPRLVIQTMNPKC